MNNVSSEREFLKSLTVLYVEDEEFTREIFSNFMVRIFGEVVTAKNGVEGLAAYREQSPDIVITDIEMPLMDGIAMIKEIRNLDAHKSVPIFVMTAVEQVEYLQRSSSLGGCEYVFKPLDPGNFAESLFTCARRLLEDNKLMVANRH